MKTKVLIVEDDQDFLTILCKGMEREGYAVSAATSARQMADLLSQDIPHIILLDLMLPDSNSFDLIADIRAITNVPIIVISGKGDLADKIVGLEMGADDYIVKPFQIRELSARIKVQVRRYSGKSSTRSISIAEEKVGFEKWVLDRARLQIFDENGHSGNLTFKEFQLLDALIKGAGRVQTRDQLLDMARSSDFNVTDRAIDTQITRIRRKIGDDAAHPRIIEAVRGAGYIFIAPLRYL